jgi:transposase-like protein
VTERPNLTTQGYRRFRCRDCDQQFNERSDGVLNRASLPSDIIAFVVFCRLRYPSCRPGCSMRALRRHGSRRTTRNGT